LFVVCVTGKLLHSSSTWWAIVAQYRLQEESKPLLSTVLQTATFSYLDTVPYLYTLRSNKYLKISNRDWFQIKSKSN